MEANELRVNNWIIEPGQDENKPFQIFSIYHEAGNNKINGLPITYFKPIPLTEDWLIRSGFEWIDQLLIYADKLHEITNDFDGFIFVPFCTNDTDCFIKIKYVHQLQNLYFALTGTELTIKN